MNRYKIHSFVLALSLLWTTGCDRDLLDQVNPNAPSTESFWTSANDAQNSVIAAYGALQLLGTYSRWLHFAYDLRSDEGFSQSPWTDLANFTRFVMNNYNFEPSQDIWLDHYRGIYRTNQIITNVPGIEMDEELKTRLLAEAHFLRGLFYFNLVSLYGNVPLVLEPSSLEYVPQQGTIAQVWEQVIADLQVAKAGLPDVYENANDRGRATRGSATALLGKSYMQLRQWADAERELGEVINSNRYALVPNYLDNFTMTNENNSESVFEVQFSDQLQGDGQDVPGASEGNNRAQFFGPRGIGWSDGQPRGWIYDEFMQETDRNGNPDPRRDVTIFHSGLPVYGQTYEQRGYDPEELFWRKYQNDRTRNFENNHSGINIRVIRYADVLLMYAEALNELGRTAEAIPYVDQVRTRANMRTLAEAGMGGMTQEPFRNQLMHERVTELAGEGVRWNDLKRWGLLDSPAGIQMLSERDPNFNNFEIGKSDLLPLPRTDVDISGLNQNPGW
jgi:starch-binding outer membrane protein, SusD/RagB family